MFNDDIKERDGSEHTKMMARTLFTIEHREPCSVRMSETLHAPREECACVRVRSGVRTTPSVTFKAVATVWTRNSEKTTTSQQLRFVLETIRTGTMRVIHIPVKTEETQTLSI